MKFSGIFSSLFGMRASPRMIIPEMDKRDIKPGDFIVVYVARSTAGANVAIKILSRSGFAPYVMNESHGGRGARYYCEIAVPAVYENKAREMLALWEKQCNSRVEKLSREANKSLIILFAAIAFLVTIVYLLKKFNILPG